MFKQEILTLTVKYEDVFHLKNLYKLMREWFFENGYTDKERGGMIPEDYMETFYLEKITQQGGREVWWWWRTKMEISSYIQRRLNVDCHVLYMKDVEVMEKGHKFKTQKGEIEVKIHVILVADPDKKWETHPLLGRIHEFFRKRVFKQEWDQEVADFKKDAYLLHEDIKRYLQIQVVDEREIFHPERGI